MYDGGSALVCSFVVFLIVSFLVTFAPFVTFVDLPSLYLFRVAFTLVSFPSQFIYLAFYTSASLPRLQCLFSSRFLSLSRSFPFTLAFFLSHSHSRFLPLSLSLPLPLPLPPYVFAFSTYFLPVPSLLSLPLFYTCLSFLKSNLCTCTTWLCPLTLSFASFPLSSPVRLQQAASAGEAAAADV